MRKTMGNCVFILMEHTARECITRKSEVYTNHEATFAFCHKLQNL